MSEVCDKCEDCDTDMVASCPTCHGFRPSILEHLRARVTTLESRLAKWREVGDAASSLKTFSPLCKALAAAREADREADR
jgi:hypothetical protein